MNVQFVKIDETNLWNEEFRSKYKITKVMATYVFNPEEEVNCCEVTPSYDMRFCGSEPECGDLDDDEHQDMAEEVFTADAENEVWRYMHCSFIQKLNPQDANGDFESLDEAAEEWQCNPW